MEKKDLINPITFVSVYLDNCKKYETTREAYEVTEQEYMNIHNTYTPKYASFASFRQVKNRLIQTNQV